MYTPEIIVFLLMHHQVHITFISIRADFNSCFHSVPFETPFTHVDIKVARLSPSGVSQHQVKVILVAVVLGSDKLMLLIDYLMLLIDYLIRRYESNLSFFTTIRLNSFHAYTSIAGESGMAKNWH